ncbi:MAG: hypothetical protein WBD27_18500 [Pyrinomonadaceae bacterium]
MRFASVNARLRLGKNARTFKNDFKEVFENQKEYSDKLLLACELYCAAYFDEMVKSRFVTLITAVEALLTPKNRSAKIRKLIGEFARSIKDAELDEEEKEPLLSALHFIKKESIGQAGRNLAGRELNSSKYDGRSSSDFFKFCYKIRSQLVHSGKSKLTTSELVDLSNTCSKFVGDLLGAHIGGNETQVVPFTEVR